MPRREVSASGVRRLPLLRQGSVRRPRGQQGGSHRRDPGARGGRGPRDRGSEAQHRNPRARARSRGGHGRRLPSGPVDEASARHVPRRREDRRDRRRGHRAHRRRDALGAPARRRRGRRGRGDKAARLPEKVPSKVLDPVEEQAALRPAGGRPRLRSSHRPGAGVASGGSCRARREST